MIFVVKVTKKDLRNAEIVQLEEIGDVLEGYYLKSSGYIQCQFSDKTCKAHYFWRGGKVVKIYTTDRALHHVLRETKSGTMTRLTFKKKSPTISGGFRRIFEVATDEAPQRR